MAKVVSRAVQGKASKGHIVLINCQSRNHFGRLATALLGRAGMGAWGDPGIVYI